jgi:cytidylate kinase
MRYLEKDAGGSILRYISGFAPIRKSYLYKTIIDKQGFIDGHHYVELLDEIIRQIATEDNVVIIGRGGQYILQSHPNTLHLLLMANRDDRIEFLRRKYDIRTLQAEHIVTRQDKIRSNLFRYFGKEDYDNPLLYHLVLNMSRIGMNEALHLVQTLLQEQSQSGARSATASG